MHLEQHLLLLSFIERVERSSLYSVRSRCGYQPSTWIVWGQFLPFQIRFLTEPPHITAYEQGAFHSPFKRLHSTCNATRTGFLAKLGITIQAACPFPGSTESRVRVQLRAFRLGPCNARSKAHDYNHLDYGLV